MVKCSMDQNDRDEAVDGPVVSEGGRSPSALSPGQGTPAAAKGGAAVGPLAPGQRWSAPRKREVVLRLMRGEAAELLSRELGLPLFKLEQWRQRAEAALEGALKGPGHCPGPRPTRRTANPPPPCSASAS
jgi:transposase